MIKADLRTSVASGEPTQLLAEDALRRFGSALTAQASDRLLDLNLTLPQLRVIRTVGRLGRASGRQLADEFDVSPAAIVPVCDRLERMRYLRRVRDKQDRRICWFELTESGAGTLDFVSHNISARIRPALKALSDNDRKTLAGILETLTNVLTQGHPARIESDGGG